MVVFTICLHATLYYVEGEVVSDSEPNGDEGGKIMDYRYVH